MSLEALAARWAAFREKVRARTQEIYAEGDAAYKEVIAIDVVDWTGLTGVSTALKARLQQLSAKVGDSWDTIDAELDKLDLDGAVYGRFRDEQQELGEQLKRWIDRGTEDFIVRHEADAARALHAKAQGEVAVPVPCSHCGAGLERPISHIPINITCPFCKAVTTATPGTAAALFAGGTGAIALAFEAALPEWHALQQAEDEWHRLRHRAVEDLAQYELATRRYWTAFAAARGTYQPGWGAKDVEAEIVGKMGHFQTFTSRSDQEARAAMSAGLAAVRTGDANQVIAWARTQRDPANAAEELVTAVGERGLPDWVKWLTPIARQLGADID